MNNMFWFGNSCIYVDVVNDIIALCESAVEEAGYTARELSDEVTQFLEDVVEMKTFLEDPTNAIISAILIATRDMLEAKLVEQLGFEVDIDYYVNGEDSHLYIGDEEYFDGEDTITKLIAKAKDVFNDKLVPAMAAAGYHYDDINSNDSYYLFNSEYSSIEFANPKEIEEWLDGVVFDDPEMSLKVEKIMHPERFN